jgi:hypothetical protein
LNAEAPVHDALCRDRKSSAATHDSICDPAPINNDPPIQHRETLLWQYQGIHRSDTADICRISVPLRLQYSSCFSAPSHISPRAPSESANRQDAHSADGLLQYLSAPGVCWEPERYERAISLFSFVLFTGSFCAKRGCPTVHRFVFASIIVWKHKIFV